MTGIHKLTVSVLALVGAALLGPGAAQACGMFNCSATAAVLQPIEQNAERILFELNDDGTVTAIVEIAYTGDPQDFSWVVPVPEAPELDVVPPSTLLLLDDATAPVLTSQPTRCRERGYGCSVAGSSGVLLGCADSAIYGGERGLADYDGGVEVITYPQVGPYLSEYVSADDPAALITWLNENGYLLTEEMEPFVATYVAQGMGFLAMKLAGDTDTSSVAPISMRYPAENPSIPLVLTSVSAEPDMGVMVFVAGSQRYQSANWSNILVDPQDVQAQPWTGGTNYYPLVSYLVDKVGGRAFVTEYSGDLDTTSSIASTRWSGAGSYSTELDWLAGLNSRHTTLTRMYTRISGWEMSSDPIFEPSEGGEVPNTLDLSNNEPVDICGELQVTPTCGSTYCGEGASCATTEAGEGCICPTGTVARQIQSPQLNGLSLFPTVVCQELDFDLMGSVDDLAPGGNSDPCWTADCGPGGECVALNGFATCSCSDGGAAVASTNGSGVPTCLEVLEVYSPEEALLPSPTEVAQLAPSRPRPSGAALLLAALLLPIIMLRRPAR